MHLFILNLYILILNPPLYSYREMWLWLQDSDKHQTAFRTKGCYKNFFSQKNNNNTAMGAGDDVEGSHAGTEPRPDGLDFSSADAQPLGETPQTKVIFKKWHSPHISLKLMQQTHLYFLICETEGLECGSDNPNTLTLHHYTQAEGFSF